MNAALAHRADGRQADESGPVLAQESATFRLAERVEGRLKATGLSAYRAATLVGKGETFVRDILRGRVRSPGAAALSDLATVLECSTAYLLGETDEVSAEEHSSATGLIRVPDASGLEAEGAGIVVFQLGGAVLAAGVEWDRIERRVRDQLHRYGEMSLARKLPFPDRPIDLRNVTIRVWGKDPTTPGAIYRAWCSETLVDTVVRGAKLEVPWDLVPGEPVELAMKAPRPRLTLTGPAEDVTPPQRGRTDGPAPTPRPFTARDILELRPFDRDAVIPAEAARKAASLSVARFLAVLSRAELVDRTKLEPLWLAKAARAMRQASEALELALNFGKAEARAEAQTNGVPS